LDHGYRNTSYLNRVTDGLKLFAGWLESTGGTSLAESLLRSLQP
jgi:hypothetical protein